MRVQIDASTSVEGEINNNLP